MYNLIIVKNMSFLKNLFSFLVYEQTFLIFDSIIETTNFRKLTTIFINLLTGNR